MSPARRLLRDRAAVAFGVLFLLLALSFFAAPLYASEVAHTTFSESRVSEQIVLDGDPTFIVSLLGVPIGPTWEGSYLLGADEIGRDLMVRLLPQGGYVPLTEDPVQWFRHLLLPWIAAAVPFAGAYVQFVRASLLQAVDQEWVRTARAKGLSEKRVIRRHVLRNGLIPPVNLWGLDLSTPSAASPSTSR